MNRPQAPAILQANLVLVGAMLIGLLLAMVLGATLGESDFTPLLVICLGILGVLFAVGLYRYVWQIALFFLFFGFSFRPAGFSFGGLELGCGLGVGVIALFFWQKRTLDRPAPLTVPSFQFLQRTLFIWLLYVALHMVYNLAAPYRSSEFALSNSIKSYFAVSAPLLLLFFFSRSPAGLVVRKDFFWTIARLCLFGVLVNLGIRIYELAGGYSVYIPVVEASSGVYALRSLGPIGMILGAVGLTAPAGRKNFVRFVTYWILLLASGLGAAMSGGRATLVIGFVSVCVVLVLRRKVVALFVVLMLGILGVAAANLSADWINTKADPLVQRSMQWVLLQKKGEATRSIESSTDWRRELFNRTIDEWRSDPRIFWTGRSTYGFGVADETAVLISGGYQALIESSLRRGATHNLISDLLIAYGIIGCVLYLTLIGSIIYFLWRTYHFRRLSPPAANLTLAALVGSVFHLTVSIIGGNFFPAELTWFLVILFGSFYSGVGLDQRPDPAMHREKVVRHPPPIRVPLGQRRLVRTTHDS